MWEKFFKWCAKVRVVAAEVASTLVFIVFLYVVTRNEIAHLLGK